MITCVPEIKTIQMQGDDKFLIIACDGIWDCLTSQECVDVLGKGVKARKPGHQAPKVIEDMFD